MSFFRKKPSKPAPRPVPKKVAAKTTAAQQTTAAEKTVTDEKRRGAGKARRRTRLTGARGIEEEARTRRKTLLGV